MDGIKKRSITDPTSIYYQWWISWALAYIERWYWTVYYSMWILNRFNEIRSTENERKVLTSTVRGEALCCCLYTVSQHTLTISLCFAHYDTHSFTRKWIIPPRWRLVQNSGYLNWLWLVGHVAILAFYWVKLWQACQWCDPSIFRSEIQRALLRLVHDTARSHV